MAEIRHAGAGLVGQSVLLAGPGGSGVAAFLPA